MNAEIILTSAARHLSTTLVGRGFKRSGRKFVRRGGDVVSLIDLQLSRTGTAEKGEFVINYGAIVPALSDGSDSASPLPSDCHWRARVSDANGVERWRSVRANDDANELGTWLVEVVERDVLIALDSLQRADDFIRLWSTGQGPGLTEIQRLLYLGILLHRAGRHAEFVAVKRELEVKVRPSDRFGLRAIQTLRDLKTDPIAVKT